MKMQQQTLFKGYALICGLFGRSNFRFLLLQTATPICLFLPQHVAAQVCGPDTMGINTVTCSANTYGPITYAASDGVTVVLDNPAMAVTGTGANSIGAWTNNVGVSTTNTLTINADNFATIDNVGRGLAVTQLGTTGDSIINIDGNGLINATRALDGFGALIFNGLGTTGDATITMNSGTVRNTGNRGAGLLANTIGDGNTTVIVNGGTIETSGQANGGVLSIVRDADQNSTSVARVEIHGNTTIRTAAGLQGLRSGGAIATNVASGRAEALMTGGTIELRGSGAGNPGAGLLQVGTGLMALVGHPTNPANINNTSDAVVTMTGGEITAGDYEFSSAAIAANWASGGASISVSGNSTIRAVGLNSSGVAASIQSRPGTALNSSTAQATVRGPDVLVEASGVDNVGVLAFTAGNGNAIVGVHDGATVSGSLAGVSAATQGHNGVVLDVDPNNSNLPRTRVFSTSDGHGVWVRQRASGQTSTFDIRVGDRVTVTSGNGSTSNGILVASQTGNTGTIEIEHGALVDASNSTSSGIAGIVDEDGDATIIVAGEVLGGISAGNGDDILSLDAFFDPNSNTLVGAEITGAIDMGNGSDRLTIDRGVVIAGVLATGLGSIDGGDDVSSADNTVDVLDFAGYSGTFLGTDLVNWEIINIGSGPFGPQGALVGGDVTFTSDPAVPGSDQLVSGLDSGTHTISITPTQTQTYRFGLNVQSGSFARFDGDFTLNANLFNAGAPAGGRGGTIDLRVDGVVGTRLDVLGDYMAAARSRLDIDVFLNDGGLDNLLATDRPISDQFVVAGDATGTTSLFVRNLSGPGALTDRNRNGVVDNDEGILFAQVRGNSTAGLFTLGAPVTAGAFTYDLVSFDPSRSQSGFWDYVLASRFSETSEIAETYPRSIFVLADMPTLHQRVGNRKWTGASQTIPEQIFCKNPDTNYRCTLTPEQRAYYEDEHIIEEDGSWIRVYGARQDIDPSLSTTNSSYRIDTAGVQLGHDWLMHETDDGSKWIAGLNGEVDTAYVRGNDGDGDGTTKTTAIGVGGTLTYYKPNGFYVDLQARVMGARTDFSASSGSYDGADATVYSASVEVGRKIPIGENGWHVVPQAQLVASNVRFDSFVDDNGTRIEPDNAQSRRARLGVSVGREKSWLHEDGSIRRLETEVGAHVYKELAGETRVVVGGTELFNEDDDVIGEITLGGTYNWKDDQNSVYGEIGVQRSLRNFGSNRRISGTIGFRHRWE